MFNIFKHKKIINTKQARPVDYKDTIFDQAQKMVRFSGFSNDFLGYNSKLINPESRPELCQIIMEKGGYTATTVFEKGALDNNVEEIWKELLKPLLTKCKQCIDKQMKQAFQDIMYEKFLEEERESRLLNDNMV